MFSRCEYCQHQQRVTVKQLRRYRGLLKCRNCHKPFDALASLSEKFDKRELKEPSEQALPWLKDSKPVDQRVWRFANLGLLLVLLGQASYFQAGQLLRSAQVQAIAERVCQTLPCRVPAYFDVADWSVSNSDLLPYLQGRYLFSAAISNQSDVRQTFPQLKLTLLDFNGRPVAERVFESWQYVDQQQLAGEESRELRLWLAAPGIPVGGFNVSVL